MLWQAYKWYIYIFFCINMNILRVNMGWSGNMWIDTASKKAPRGENPALVWLYLCFCGVRAEAQRPRCIQGKCDWGGEAAPNPSLMQGDVLFIRGTKASSVFNSETTATVAEGTTRFPSPLCTSTCVELVAPLRSKKYNNIFLKWSETVQQQPGNVNTKRRI